MNVWMCACMYVWMDGRVGGWVDGWKLRAVSEPCLHVPSCRLKRARVTQGHLLGTTRVRGGALVGPRPVASLVRLSLANRKTVKRGTIKCGRSMVA